MILCVCHAVSETEVRELARAGATPDEVARLTSAGTSCGVCVRDLHALVHTQRPPCGKAEPCPGCECVSEGDGCEALDAA